MSIFNSSSVIKQGFMVKRSQNKKLYTLVNYKKRWFVLTRKYLIYYEDDNGAVSDIKQLKTQITISIGLRLFDS